MQALFNKAGFEPIPIAQNRDPNDPEIVYYKPIAEKRLRCQAPNIKLYLNNILLNIVASSPAAAPKECDVYRSRVRFYRPI
jgi:hypothetical protein